MDTLVMENSAPAQAASSPEFLFTSGQGTLSATDWASLITTPACEWPLLEQQIASALAAARPAGQANPLLIGCLRVRPGGSSCLYVPAAMSGDRPVPAAQAPVTAAMANQVVEANRVISVQSTPPASEFQASVSAALDAFAQGRLAKVVLSRKLTLTLHQPADPTQVMARLMAQNPHAFHFSLPLGQGRRLLGASPELLLRVSEGEVFTHPLARSARRASEPAQEQMVARDLLASRKDQHEHKLVIDEIRRVLTPHCRELAIPSSPSLMSTDTLWHLGTPIAGRLNGGEASVLSLACQLHPTPALCGYPTELARQFIREQEPFRRALFSGIVGWCDSQGNGEWAVVIRCGVLDGHQVELFAGAGIVAGSDPPWSGPRPGTKLGTMLKALGLDLEVAQ
uniref:Putative isochorismate synthase n=1 Tax=Aeromonas hydrophila TaxID=644 RepID=AMOA_AERHY|nr:RecName: Full=Putative isochorismate synthase; AltName: Full=Amonabactin; AltName: Full=Isochorismate mutase [Aeromonas hydrophila]AAA21935.1 amonabactin [Aeromonas hydrophila]